MRKAVFVLALLFSVNLAVDAFDASCAQSVPSQPCHACVCQTPSLPPGLASVQRVVLPKVVFVAAAFESFSDRLADDSLFRPPISLA